MNNHHRLKSFIFLVILTISCKTNIDKIRSDFGVKQNENRIKLHLAPVDLESDFKEDITYEARRFIFVNENEKSITSPAFLRKTIMLDSSGKKVLSEEDYYANPISNSYLIVTHSYFDGKTMIVLQANHESSFLSVAQADSVLRSWSVDVNPFTDHSGQ